MARLTRTQALSSPEAGGYYNNALLAILASATNPDGTPYALPVANPTPLAADILVGRQAFTATTAATTLITIPAGRVWVGTIGASVAVANSAAAVTAGLASAVVTIAGAGATPTGAVLGVDAVAGTNAATGTVGSQSANALRSELTVAAPVGNAVTVQVAATCTGTTARVDAFASGTLVAQ